MRTLETGNPMHSNQFEEVNKFIDLVKGLALGICRENSDKRYPYAYSDLEEDMEYLNLQRGLPNGSSDVLEQNFEYPQIRDNEDRYDLNQYFAFLELIRSLASFCLENVRFKVADEYDDSEQISLYEREVIGFIVSLMIIKDVESKSMRLQISLDSIGEGDFLGYDLIIEDNGVLTIIRRDDDFDDESEEFRETSIGYDADILDEDAEILVLHMDKGKIKYIDDTDSFWEVFDNFRDNISGSLEFLDTWLRLHLIEILSKHRDILSFWPKYEVERDVNFEVYDTIIRIVTNLINGFASYSNFEIPRSSKNIRLSGLFDGYEFTFDYDRSSYEEEGIFATIEISNMESPFDGFFITMHEDGSIFISENNVSSAFAWIAKREYPICLDLELLTTLEGIVSSFALGRY